MERIEKFNAQKCEIKFILNNGETLVKKFCGDENPYQEYEERFFSKKINYLNIYHYQNAINKAKCFIYDLVKNNYEIIDNKMIKFSDIKSAEIINIEDYFVPVKLRKYIPYD